MTKHIKHVEVKQMDINEVKFLAPEELDDIKTDKRIIAGFRKDFLDIILLSDDYNESRGVPTVDLRTFTPDRNTGKMIPTRAGLRLDPGAFSALISMLDDNKYLVQGPQGPDREHEHTAQSNHLEEQVMEETE